jgi:Outer membrane protein beta-barrel domain
MRSPVQRSLAVAALLASFAIPALAQEDEEGRFALGVGGGLVTSGGSSDPYLTANLRMRIGYRVAGEERQGSVFGFVEPEVGYSTRSIGTFDAKDTLIGVNVGGAVRLRVFEYFVAGGVGYHLTDETGVTSGGQSLDVSDNNVGVDAQFGFDVRLNQVVSIFGVGRYDLVQETDEQRDAHRRLGVRSGEQQTKVYLGLRVHL